MDLNDAVVIWVFKRVLHFYECDCLRANECLLMCMSMGVDAQVWRACICVWVCSWVYVDTFLCKCVRVVMFVCFSEYGCDWDWERARRREREREREREWVSVSVGVSQPLISFQDFHTWSSLPHLSTPPTKNLAKNPALKFLYFSSPGKFADGLKKNNF